jgi:hypothetical protein
MQVLNLTRLPRASKISYFSDRLLVLAQHTPRQKEIEDLPAVSRELRGLPQRERARARQSNIDHALDLSRPGCHDHNVVGEKHRFGNAVRDEQNGHAPFVPELLQIEHQLIARQRIQRAEWLVHEELRRIVDKCPTKRDALTHPAGELMRVLVLKTSEADRAQQTARARLCGLAVELLRLGLQHHVAERSAPFQQHRILKHDADVGARSSDRMAIDRDDAIGRVQQAGRNHEQRALAAAARSKHGNKFPAARAHRDPIERAHGTVLAGVDLAYPLYAEVVPIRRTIPACGFMRHA